MFRLSRAYSTIQNAVHLEKLTGRKLIKISGNEVGSYLQGLITNDVQHLEHGAGSMYSMFLNTKGRILYDTLVYKTGTDNSYLLECDAEALQPLEKHLKMFRVRRKIDIVDLQDAYDVFVLYNPDCTNCETTVPPCGKKDEAVTRVIGDMFIYRDPRIVQLGSRIIAPKNCDVEAEISKLTTLKPASTNYRKFRYSLGVGEGVNDLPPGDCLPLEANCDYLHGVSFHKGCYIGQELTARTYHTGVIRKRLMPLFLDKTIKFDSPKEIKIEHESTNLGKLRGAESEVALGLIRVAQAVDAKKFKVGEATATTRKPIWWPIEAPKEKMTA